MSKSAANFLSLRDVLAAYSPQALRFFFLSAHYRSPLEYRLEVLDQAEAAVRKIYERVRYLESAKATLPTDEKLEQLTIRALDFVNRSLDDDFNTPKAISALFDTIKNSEIHLNNGYRSANFGKVKKFFDEIFGIIPETIEELPPEVETLKLEREAARDEKNYVRADEIRQKIEKLGYKVSDTPYGPLVKRNR